MTTLEYMRMSISWSQCLFSVLTVVFCFIVAVFFPKSLSLHISDRWSKYYVHLPIDRESGRPRGFAFVEMVDEKEEDAAIEALDEAEWMGRSLKVNKAKPRESSDSFGGGRGGFNGGGGRPSGGGRNRY